jgi:hypothetical protein
MTPPPTLRRPRAARIVVLTVASLLLAVALAAVLRAGALPFVPDDVDPARVGLANLAIYSAAWLVVVFLKAWRWRFQLAPVATVPLTRVVSCSVLGSAATLLLPFRSGEFARPALITRGTAVTFFAAVSTSASERIIDAVFASFVLLVSLGSADVLSPLPDHIGQLAVPTRIVTVLGTSAAAVSIAAVTAAVLFYRFHATALWLIRTTIGRLWPALGEWLAHSLGEFARGLSFLASRHALGFALISTAYWALYWWCTWFLLSRSGFPTVSWAQTGAVVGTLAFSMSLPNAPGFFGTFQIAVYASLALFFPPLAVQTDGAVFVFWLYALQLGWIFTLVPLALWVERAAQRKAVLAAAGTQASSPATERG